MRNRGSSSLSRHIDFIIMNMTIDKIIKKNKYYIDKLSQGPLDKDELSIWLIQVNNFLEEYDNEKTNLISELSLLP